MSDAFPSLTVEELTAAQKGAMKIGPFGSQLRKEEMVERGVKVYGQENVIADDWTLGDRRISSAKHSALSSCELKTGDVVVSMMGTAGKCAVFPAAAERGIMDSHLLRVQPNLDLIEREYFATVLQAENIIGRQVAAMSHGSIMAGLSSKIVKEFRIPVPPLLEQPRIVEVLATIDTAIRETEALIDKLKAVKQGLLHDLLTRGIDANGQLRPPQSEAPQLYKESPLGWIPREWDVRQLESLLAEVDPAMRSGPFGSALLKEELVEVGPPLLGIDNVHTERFVAEFKRCVTPAKFRQLARYAVRPADLMITIMGTVGRCCLVPDDIGSALSSKHTWTISLDRDRYSPFLAMLQVNYSPWVAQHFARDQQGGTMMAIRSDTLRSLLLPVPSRDEQKVIEARLREVGNRIDTESSALGKMKVEKSGLMDDLLTGRVRVTPLLESMQQPAAPTGA